MTPSVVSPRKKTDSEGRQLAAEQAAAAMVADARARGFELTGPNGLLKLFTKHLAEVYGASISKETISRITDKVVAEMTEWSSRPLDAVFIDAIVVKGVFTDDGVIASLAVSARRCDETGRGLPRMKVPTPPIRKTSTCPMLLLTPDPPC